MDILCGHEAGNGGHSQGDTYGYRRPPLLGKLFSSYPVADKRHYRPLSQAVDFDPDSDSDTDAEFQLRLSEQYWG
jgi:hypothetical protein